MGTERGGLTPECPVLVLMQPSHLQTISKKSLPSLQWEAHAANQPISKNLSTAGIGGGPHFRVSSGRLTLRTNQLCGTTFQIDSDLKLADTPRGSTLGVSSPQLVDGDLVD